MPIHQGPSSRRSRQCGHPPQDYRDLTPTDIECLARVFAVRAHSTSDSAHRDELRHTIQALPSHLRSKIPLLTSFCSRHDKLNPLPIISIMNSVKHAITPTALNQWKPALSPDIVVTLEDMSATWTPRDDFRALHGRHARAFGYQGHKCAACQLHHLAANVQDLRTLGTIVVASIDPVKWKRSKRILWMEEWIKTSVEFSHQAQPLVLQMWEDAVELLNQRSGTDRKGDATRPYIDEFIAGLEAVHQSRPISSPTVEERIRLNQAVSSTTSHREAAPAPSPLSHGDAVPTRSRSSVRSSAFFAYALRCQSGAVSPSHAPGTWSATASSQALPSVSRWTSSTSDTPPSSAHDVPAFEQTLQTRGRCRPVASSVYSRPEFEDDEEPEYWDTEDEIIDSYRRQPRGFF